MLNNIAPSESSEDNDAVGLSNIITTPANNGNNASHTIIPSFQSFYLESLYLPWSSHYLDYPRLLALLRSAKNSTTTTTTAGVSSNRRPSGSKTLNRSTRSIISSLPTDHIVKVFIDELDDEIDKITLFVMKQQGKIADKFLNLLDKLNDNDNDNDFMSRMAGTNTYSTGNIVSPRDVYMAAQQLHLLLQYIRTNILAIDKLLSVHDRIIGLQTGIKIEYHYLNGAIGRERTLRNATNYDSVSSSTTNYRTNSSSSGGSIRNSHASFLGNKGRLDVTYRYQGITALVGLAETVYYKWKWTRKSTRDLNRTFSSKFQEHEDVEIGGDGGGGGVASVAKPKDQEPDEEMEFKALSREVSLVRMLPVSDGRGEGGYGSTTTTSESKPAVVSEENMNTAQALLQPPTIVNTRMVKNMFNRINLALTQLGRSSSFVERWALASGIERSSRGIGDTNDEGAATDAAEHDEVTSTEYDSSSTDEEDDDDDSDKALEITKRQKRRQSKKYTAEMKAQKKNMSSKLNLINSFLYMVSYYMVAPTSGAYAERLGLSPSMSGAIIGFTAVAALASTFLYSYWTSHSYRDALIFSSICCLVGNVIYAMGLPYDSLTLVLTGRFLNGFGSARAINRRFIADAFTNADRTAASAAFVASSAAGMSFGPALSALMPFVVSKNSLWWKEENAPAWIVAVLWMVFLIAHVMYFEDPPKTRKSVSSSINVPVVPQKSTSDGTIMQPLVGSSMDGDTKYHTNRNGNKGFSKKTKSFEKPLWKRPACLVTIYLVFLLKAILELVLSSAAPLADYYFGWSTSATGWYLAIGNGLVLPAVSLVTYLSRYFQDRQLILFSSMGMLIGSLVVIHYSLLIGPTYTMGQYILGTCLLFIAPNVMEAPSMSLLSKNIPESLRSGIFNLGFFTTEAGFGGRVVADSYLTLMGSFGIEGLLNNLYSSLAIVNGLTLALVYANYDELIEPHEHED